MPTGERHAPDVAIIASASADELRFETQPESRTRFPGSGERDSRQSTTKRNIDSPVETRRTYRRVFAATRISSRLVEAQHDIEAG
jgi:hypothetical protein